MERHNHTLRCEGWCKRYRNQQAVNQHVRLYAQAREEQPAKGRPVGDIPLFLYCYYQLPMRIIKPNIVTAVFLYHSLPATAVATTTAAAKATHPGGTRKSRLERATTLYTPKTTVQNELHYPFYPRHYRPKRPRQHVECGASTPRRLPICLGPTPPPYKVTPLKATAQAVTLVLQ